MQSIGPRDSRHGGGITVPTRFGPLNVEKPFAAKVAWTKEPISARTGVFSTIWHLRDMISGFSQYLRNPCKATTKGSLITVLLVRRHAVEFNGGSRGRERCSYPSVGILSLDLPAVGFGFFLSRDFQGQSYHRGNFTCPGACQAARGSSDVIGSSAMRPIEFSS